MSLCSFESSVDHTFIGCNGTYTNKELQDKIDEAVKSENYEWAAACKAEIDRRESLINLDCTPVSNNHWLKNGFDESIY